MQAHQPYTGTAGTRQYAPARMHAREHAHARAQARMHARAQARTQARAHARAGTLTLRRQVRQLESVSAKVHLMSRRGVHLAWKTHYIGDARAASSRCVLFPRGTVSHPAWWPAQHHTRMAWPPAQQPARHRQSMIPRTAWYPARRGYPARHDIPHGTGIPHGMVNPARHGYPARHGQSGTARVLPLVGVSTGCSTHTS